MMASQAKLDDLMQKIPWKNKTTPTSLSKNTINTTQIQLKIDDCMHKTEWKNKTVPRKKRKKRTKYKQTTLLEYPNVKVPLARDRTSHRNTRNGI